ncbi:Septin [Neoconidiobolus thromboides FSU 785]|nr:Septin [Neoconidiobolus thromboides FSU 785]
MPLFNSASAWHRPSFNQIVLSDILGVHDLPKQRIKRVNRQAFVFNLMIAGESGLGKTTFINTLFNTDIYENVYPKAPQKTDKVSISSKSFELQEENTSLNLTVIDTPGFGDRLNREEDLIPIHEYIDAQFERYLQQENNNNHRERYQDTRVHALLYFVAPGAGLRDIDIMVLKELSDKVNIIPVIAKADTIMPNEKEWNKKKILNQLKHHDIKTYVSDYSDEHDLNQELVEHYPFTVMGSQGVINKGDNLVRGRKFRWGVAEVDNPEHCDFIHLQQMLMNNCLLDILESTHSIHYFKFRATKLRRNGRPESILACDEEFMKRLEDRKIEFSDDMIRKEEELRLKFVNQVREKEQTLRDREEQLHSNSQKMMAEIERERRQLELETREIEQQLAQLSV